VPTSPETGLVGQLAAPSGGDQVLEAVQLLYEAVIRGTLAPGTVATQVHLAELLGVGRTPLREALRIGHGDGLLEFGGRRITISELSALDVEELYVMRITLESLGVRATLPTLRSADFGELEALMARMAHFLAEGEFDQVEESNKRFHAILVSATQPRTRRLLTQLDRHAERYRRALYAASPGGHLVAQDEHRAILDAAKCGDVQATIRLLVGHYSRTAHSVIALLDTGYDAPRLEMAIKISTTDLDPTPERSGVAKTPSRPTRRPVNKKETRVQ
jgi:DNA-binding GntR family transcriptional regulator